MFGYSFSKCLFSSVSKSMKTSWDPTVSLTLGHPTLVLLEKCRGGREQFKQILAQMIRIHLVTETFPMSRLLVFSAVSYPENLDMAILLFNHYTPKPNLFIYNTMISALSFSSGQAFPIYDSMLRSFISPDERTFLSLIKASEKLSEGKQIHSHSIVTGFSSNDYVQNSLIKMYSGYDDMGIAHQVFQHMTERDAVSFNIMITGYARKGSSLIALDLFSEMVSTGLNPDEFTIVGLLMACGRLRNIVKGNSVYAWIVRRNLFCGLNSILGNAILDMYVKCEKLDLARRIFDAFSEKDKVSWNTMIAGYAKVGELESARALFDEMGSRDHVSWNSLIAGYSHRGDWPTLMNLFKDMISMNVVPDKVTVVSLVSAASEMGNLNQGRWIHGWVVRNEMKFDAFLGSAFIDMYCKCGSIETGLKIFNTVTTEKDVTLWTAMIAGLAFHGYGNRAMELFWSMQENLTPNQVTFIAVLTACSHSGMVDQGIEIFKSMKEIYGVEPRVEHYGCLVDLLARAGRLSEAKNVIDKMPMKPSRSIWGAMLNSSKAYGNVELAEFASKELLKLEPEREGGYVLLSNTYAADGRWKHSNKIREIMESNGVKKVAGSSGLVVDGVLHEFVAADNRHPRKLEIYSIVDFLKREMKPSLSGSSSDNLQHLLVDVN